MSASYRITLQSDASSWINRYIPSFISGLKKAGHRVKWLHSPVKTPKGDFAFYLSCSQIVPPQVLRRNKHNLVVHESALPKGRGWSPLTWQIVKGRNFVPITLFEAAEKVDSGVIYLQDTMRFTGTELVDELRRVQAKKTFALCRTFIRRYPAILNHARIQKGSPSFFPRRGPQDSRLDPYKTFREQFNLLRVVDNERYPAFFALRGSVYRLKILKASEQKGGS